MPSFDDDDIRWLLDMLESEGLAEIEVARGELRAVVRAPETAATAIIGAVPGATREEDDPPGTSVLAPMAGIFYLTPAPDADPFVAEGDRIERGEVVGLIEAMKLFNEVNSPVAGIITNIAVYNEEQVAAGQPLMWVEPDGDGTSTEQ